MFKYALLIIIFILSNSAFAQIDYSTIESKKQETDFAFPIFKNQASAEKINQLLQLSELDILSGSQKENIFENVAPPKDGSGGGKTDISFEVQSNNNRILSLQFNKAFYGATYGYWVQYYNFNMQNGDLVQLSDLFTPSGYKVFCAMAAKKRIGAFNKEIEKIMTNELDYVVDVEDIPACYETSSLRDFYIKDNDLYIDGSNCFSKFQNTLDVERLAKFALSEFKSYLNDYGKCLFGIDKKDIGQFHSISLPQMFEGTIAGKKVVLLLNESSDNSISATYAYLQFGQAISLDGTLINQTLTLKETNAMGETTAIITTKFSGTDITGTWQDATGTKPYAVALKRK